MDIGSSYTHSGINTIPLVVGLLDYFDPELGGELIDIPHAPMVDFFPTIRINWARIAQTFIERGGGTGP
ncbi:MAG: hypothetical protein V3V44_02975 [Anaerolineales bacterium]